MDREKFDKVKLDRKKFENTCRLEQHMRNRLVRFNDFYHKRKFNFIFSFENLKRNLHRKNRTSHRK